ncbi:glucose dehydrogenase [FAD, quinone]-like [Adelges cooleyi]|nr:glucose dehydrogenase [FAD, quinone]-like [Adelges cooleyi]
MSSTRGLDDYSGKGDNLEPRDDDNSGDRSGSRSWEDDDDDDDDGECGEDSGEDASSVYEYASTYKKYNFDVGLNQVSIIGEVLTKLDQQRYMLFDDLAYHQDCTRHVRNMQHFHFIIVGAGKAGCVLANRLSENPKWNVLLIEAGGHPLPATQIPSLWPRVLNTETDWQYEINPSTATGYGIAGAMKIHKGMGLGGASMTSAPVWAIGSEQLYNELVKRGLAEWSYEKCVEYYRKIENVRFDTDKYGRGGLLPISKFHCTEWSMLQKMIMAGFVHVGCPVQNDINEPAVEAGFVSLNGVLRNGRTYNTAKAYLTPTLGRKNLQVMQHARVTKIIMDSLNLRAVGVEVRTKYGQILRVDADYEVLVAAGTIGSAQLLMVSGVGPEEHLRKMHVPVVKDLPVGKNFRHTPVFAGIVMSFDKPLMPVQSPEEIAFKYLSRYSGPLSNLNGLQMAAYLKTDVHLSYADVVVHLNYVPAKSMLRLCGLRAAYGFSDRVMNAYAALNAEKDISIITVTLVSPQSSGRIILKGCDPLEKPTVIGNTLGDQRDMDSLMNAIKIITKLTESEAMQLAGSKLEKLELEGCAVYEFNSDDYWKCAVKYLVSSTSSTSGSCSMGLETDCTAVVDSNLKVIGMSNLRVVGQSVLPLSINGYSQAASVMIAERAADIIKTTYTS